MPDLARAPVAIGTIAIATLALLSLYSSFDTKYTLYKPHPDWRSAAAYLGQQIDAGCGGTPVYTSFPNPRSLSYYDPRIQDKKNLEIELSPTQIGDKVSARLGAWLGGLAATTLKDFAGHNRRLLKNAALIIRRCKSAPAQLDWPPQRKDRTCFVIRNEWHPNIQVDPSVEELLAHPNTSVVHAERFRGVTIYKVEIQP